MKKRPRVIGGVRTVFKYDPSSQKMEMVVEQVEETEWDISQWLYQLNGQPAETSEAKFARNALEIGVGLGRTPGECFPAVGADIFLQFIKAIDRCQMLSNAQGQVRHDEDPESPEGQQAQKGCHTPMGQSRHPESEGRKDDEVEGKDGH